MEGGGDKENEGGGGESKGEASKWRQRKTMFRVETSIEEEEEEDLENDPPRSAQEFPGGDGKEEEAVLRPLQELQITSSSASADVSFRTDRSRSPLSSKRLSSHDNTAVSDSAESVFRERRGLLERPPPPGDVVAETPNVTATTTGGNDDSLNSSTASQVQ